MKPLIVFCFLNFTLAAQSVSLNQQVIDTAVFYGRTISPTYQQAVCTEYVIGVLGHFIQLTQEDTVNIRIDQPRNNLGDVYLQIENGSPEPKGVYHALIQKGVGQPIDDWKNVQKGDFVQFWYPRSWGHCGIVDSIDLTTKKMWLHSSFPSTDGYGVQKFSIPDYTWFVRLNLESAAVPTLKEELNVPNSKTKEKRKKRNRLK